MKNIHFDADLFAGNTINNYCAAMVQFCRDNQCLAWGSFNGIKIGASPKSDPEAIAKYYMEESQRRSAQYCQTNDYKKRELQYEMKKRKKAKRFDHLISESPKGMHLRDAATWQEVLQKNTDDYGAAIMRYADQWARLMERSMAKGKSLVECADECSHEADNEGITGFMYGCSVSILAKVWIHGEALRRWHNKETQLGTEGDKANETGGVLNPAMLCIGPK